MTPYTTLASNPSLTSTTTKSSKSQPATTPATAPAINYNLSAVIVHKGGYDSGHYVSYAKEGRDWFLFDDSKVVLASEGDVLNAEAYLLIYVVDEV